MARHHDTAVAVHAAVQQCDVKCAALLLVFAARRHHPAQVAAALHVAAPGVPGVGGSVAGIITREEATYGGYEVSVIAFGQDADQPYLVAADAEETTDAGMGASLGRAIIALAEKAGPTLLFYTSVADVITRRLHHGTGILAGLAEGLDGATLDIAGGGLLTDFNFEDSWILLDGEVRRHSAFALTFPPHLRFRTRVLRACLAASPPMTITAIEGVNVLSLDGRPALDVLCKILGREPSPNGNTLGLDLCLGRVNDVAGGSGFGIEHINRVIVAEDIVTRQVSLLEPDFAVGNQVRLMMRDNDYMLSSAATPENDIGNTPALLSLYIDCAGRAGILSGTPNEEGVVAMSTLRAGVPALGFYSGVEIASLDSRPAALDLTGVLISVMLN